jgi:hypothetical protein
MHTSETQQKFIERRAQGWSFVRIATELGVAKSTLIEWSRKFRFDIDNLRAIELDDLRQRCLGTHQTRVSALADQLAKVEAELRQRDLAKVPTARLYSLAAALRRELARETEAVSFVSPVNAIPADELVKQVQQWHP